MLTWSVAIIVSVSSLYTSFKVSNAELVNRVKALEDEQKSDDANAQTLLPRFFVLEQKVDNILQTIKDSKEDRQQTDEEIKQNQLRLEQKVDRLILER